MHRLPIRLICAVGLALVLLVLPARDAAATTLEAVAVECPVCEHAFEAQNPNSSNTFGGVDTDLCRHANGDQWMSFHLWTCPGCAYTRERQDFGRSVSADLAKWVRSELKPPVPIAADAEQADIPGWVKAELAILVFQQDPPADGSLGRLLRLGAWLERVESLASKRPVWDDAELNAIDDVVHARFVDAVHVLRRDRAGSRTVAGRNVSAALALLTTAAAGEGTERDVAELYGAERLRRHGEFGPSEPIFRRLVKGDDTAAPIRAAAQLCLDSIGRERSFLRRFAEGMEPGLDAEADLDAGEADLAFMLAETRRRLGDDAGAAKWLRRALDCPGLAVSERMMVHEAAAFPHVAGSQYAAVDAADWPNWLAALVADLEDEERAEETEELLGLLSDLGALDALVALLDHEDAAVRASVVFVLRGYHDLGEQALAALRRHVLDPKEEDDVRWEGIETLTRFGRAEDAALYRGLLADPDWFLPEVPVQGLAVVGDGSDVPRILALRDEIPEIGPHALSLLTNRDASDSEAFDAWWKDHATETREHWAADGFGAALPEPKDLTSRKNVPALIGLLEDESIWIRVNAQRTLAAISGENLAQRLARDEGRVPVQGELNDPPPLRDVVGGGTTLHFKFRSMVDWNDMAPALARVMQRPYAESSWARAAAIWRHWWETEGGK